MSETSGPIKVEQREIGALIPFARNSRTHSEGQIAQIAGSIREFGWTTPILVDDKDGIIAGQAVYEPFSGSGTTIIAGEMTGRAIHAIELSPQYVDVAVKRWQEFTGQEAIHEDGRKFNDLAPLKDAA